MSRQSCSITSGQTNINRQFDIFNQCILQTFTVEEQKLPESKETQTLVKVTNTKLGVSTYWSLEKFEDNLVKMREMYEVSVVLY